MHVAVFGGSGFVGTFVCRALVGCGCVVSSVSRSGDEASLGSSMRRLDGEWTSQVQWLKGDAATDPAAALADDVDAVVSCIGAPRPPISFLLVPTRVPDRTLPRPQAHRAPSCCTPTQTVGPADGHGVTEASASTLTTSFRTRAWLRRQRLLAPRDSFTWG